MHSEQKAHHIYPEVSLVLALRPEEINAMLLLIEQTHPHSALQGNQLAQLGPYNFAQLRAAIALQTLSCVDLPEPWFRLTNQRKTQKSLRDGQTVCLSAHFSSLHEHVLPRTVRIQVLKEVNSRPIIRFEFPIFDPIAIATFIRFNDYRQNQHTSLYDMQQGATQQDILHMWSGLRFLCRNLRLWKQQSGITWPEEL